MKKKIHPKYYSKAKVTCACGASFTTGSTKPEIQVEICSACHPFFTGEMKYVDTLGRVDKFISRRQKAQKTTYVKKSLRREATRKKKESEEARREKNRPKSLREMLKKK